MCGIAGAKGPTDRRQKTMDEVRRMIIPLGRRGPDGAGFGAWEGTVFGHARLAIIDLSTGDQPQSNEDESVVVVVNGEIYNYIELRAELEAKGRKFRTKSDIEVIPHLWDEIGFDFVKRLRGMFAIALYDRKKDMLVLARDRLGKKPIYFSEKDGVIRFASELKSLLEIDELDFTIDRTAIEDFLTLQYIPSPKTIFRGIEKVPAATIVSFKDGGRKTIRYWKPSLVLDEAASEDEWLDRTSKILDEAVRIRLRSDVPLGAFLSGGIDSNIVTAAASRLLPGPLKTTTISFGDVNRSEVDLARRTAEKFKTDHREKSAEVAVREAVLAVAEYLDEPLGDSSTVPTYLVSKAAREEVTVAVSGDGGDETFGGYAFRYRQNLTLDHVRRRLPGAIGKKMVGLAARLYPKADRMPRVFRWKWALENLAVSAEQAYCLDMSIFRPIDKLSLYRPEFAESLGGYRAWDTLERFFAEAPSGDLLPRLLHVDLNTYLADGVLAKVDRMSMANSLEVRSPLLDQEIVELACRIPPRFKLVGHQGKYLLRKLADRAVGPEIARAPKVGFAPPLGSWLVNELRSLFEDAVFSKDSIAKEYLRPEGIEGLWRDHASGRRNHERLLWLVLTLELWNKHFGKTRGGKVCAS